MKISWPLKWYWKFIAVHLHVTAGVVRTMWNVLFFANAKGNARIMATSLNKKEYWGFIIFEDLLNKSLHN